MTRRKRRMKDGFHVIDSDLHVIETGEVYEKYLAGQYRDAPTERLYKPVRERGYDASSTLKAMDAEGIDISVVYRTFAHMVVSIDDLEPAYATAYCAAFNDWLADYCRTNPKRLKPSAIVSLHDPELAAGEARRAVEKKGHVGVVLLP